MCSLVVKKYIFYIQFIVHNFVFTDSLMFMYKLISFGLWGALIKMPMTCKIIAEHLFERLFKIQKNGVFLIGISFRY